MEIIFVLNALVATRFIIFNRYYGSEEGEYFNYTKDVHIFNTI